MLLLSTIMEISFYRLVGGGLLLMAAIALSPAAEAKPTLETTFTEAEAISTSYGSRRRQTYLGGTGRRQIL